VPLACDQDLDELGLARVRRLVRGGDFHDAVELLQRLFPDDVDRVSSEYDGAIIDAVRRSRCVTEEAIAYGVAHGLLHEVDAARIRATVQVMRGDIDAGLAAFQALIDGYPQVELGWRILAAEALSEAGCHDAVIEQLETLLPEVLDTGQHDELVPDLIDIRRRAFYKTDRLSLRRGSVYWIIAYDDLDTRAVAAARAAGYHNDSWNNVIPLSRKLLHSTFRRGNVLAVPFFPHEHADGDGGASRMYRKERTDIEATLRACAVAAEGLPVYAVPLQPHHRDRPGIVRSIDAQLSAGQGVAWPPTADAPCWCGQAKTYANCCRALID
jgi:hypothetical protein